MRIWLYLAVALTVLAQDRRITPTTGTGRRMALIIGNDNYPWKPLKNAVNDARSLAALLPDLGFEKRDITLVTDANLKQMQRASREFIERLKPDDLAFVFYSGHGVEVRGENFLIPVDFPSDAGELEVQDEAFSAQQFLRNLENTSAKTRIVVLDACRNNPLRANRSTGGGLARMDGRGTLIVFSTSAGSTADDNARGRNGLFTSHLLEAMPTPNISLDDLMKRVAREVYRDSGGKQLPAVYGLLLEDFPLVASVALPIQTPSLAKPVIDYFTAQTTSLVVGQPASLRWSVTGATSVIIDNMVGEVAPQGHRLMYPQPPSTTYRLVATGPGGVIDAMVTITVNQPQTPTAGTTKVNSKDGSTYVWIPPGEFMMGCSSDDSECADNEKPPHRVSISQGFWIGQTPVTQAAYTRVVGRNPSHLKGADLPVETINWNDAKSYCEAIGGRLPTEAEWEYAARAGSTASHYGDLDSIAWYGGNSGDSIHPVRDKLPNAWNLYDTLGSVFQWTSDSIGKFKVLRGGSWDSFAPRVRVSYRDLLLSGSRGYGTGVRCVGE